MNYLISNHKEVDLIKYKIDEKNFFSIQLVFEKKILDDFNKKVKIPNSKNISIYFSINDFFFGNRSNFLKKHLEEAGYNIIEI